MNADWVQLHQRLSAFIRGCKSRHLYQEWMYTGVHYCRSRGQFQGGNPSRSSRGPLGVTGGWGLASEDNRCCATNPLRPLRPCCSESLEQKVAKAAKGMQASCGGRSCRETILEELRRNSQAVKGIIKRFLTSWRLSAPRYLPLPPMAFIGFRRRSFLILLAMHERLH
jgi:hypothetical protein